MFGIPSSLSLAQDFEASSHPKNGENAFVSGRKIDKFSNDGVSGSSPASGSSGEFARRLEAALGAISGRPVPGGNGKELPLAALSAQTLSDSTNLITAADVEPTPEAALYALAISQGLDPEVVAAVLWPGVEARADAIQPGQIDAAAVDGASANVDPDGAQGGWHGVIPPWLPQLRSGNDQAAVGADPFTVGQDRSGALSLAAINEGLQSGAFFAEPGNRQSLNGSLGLAAAGLGRGSAGLPPQSADATEAVLARSQFQQGGIPGASGTAMPVTGAGESMFMRSPSVANVDRPAGLTPPVLGEGSRGRSHSANGAIAVQSLFSGGELGEAAGAEAAAKVQSERADALRSIVSDPASRLRIEAGLHGGAGSDALAKSSDTLPSLPAAQWMLRQARVDAGFVSSAIPVELSAASGAESESELSPAQPAVQGDVQHLSQAQKTETIDLSLDEPGASGVGRAQPDREGLQQRMSEALAQRMVAQAGRGQWSLQLELKPAELGQISIEMTMNNGRLEALFDAGSPAARTLIHEGFDRLRQELERIGTQVAYLGMQSSSGGSTGGKPTPARFDRRAGADGDSDSIGGDVTEGLVSQSRARDDRRLDLMV